MAFIQSNKENKVSMTKQELWERISLSWTCPNCIWELDRRNGYVWEEDGMTYAVPGVAVMADGLDHIPENRGERAKALGLEWSYLMHLEQAINYLFAGNTFDYNECVVKAGEPQLQVKRTMFVFKDIEQIKELLCPSK